MLRDFREDGDLSGLPAKICIVGAGAAGITLARRLLARNHPVMLLESGGSDYEARVQELAAGSNVGLDYYDLDQVNLRMIGGTTPIWGGRCAELDPIDFERRDWVPHSGWPFGPEELAAYYDQAARDLGIARPGSGADGLRRKLPILQDLAEDALALGCWSFDDRSNRFAAPNIIDLIEHPRCWLVTHATVTALHLSSDGRRVDRLDLRDVSGRAASIAAETVVLALGGIETPRLLLNSRFEAEAGIGNSHDLVGRFFMEHPHARGGRVEGPAVWRLLEGFARTHRIGGTRHAALLHLTAEAQRRTGSLNSAITLGARQSSRARQALAMRTYTTMKHRLEPSRLNRSLWRGLKSASVWAHERTDPLRPWLLLQAGLRELAVIVRAEQAPNPESRIRLGNEVDALGMRRIELDWRLTELDRHSVKALVSALDKRLGSAVYGGVVRESWLDEPGVLWRTDPLVSAHPIGGYHHMGTTRMGLTAGEGVVNQNGRIHGIENAFICGSSTFPTSGWANPTFTILALSLRLADHLDRVLSPSG